MKICCLAFQDFNVIDEEQRSRITKLLSSDGLGSRTQQIVNLRVTPEQTNIWLIQLPAHQKLSVKTFDINYNIA